MPTKKRIPVDSIKNSCLNILKSRSTGLTYAQRIALGFVPEKFISYFISLVIELLQSLLNNNEVEVQRVNQVTKEVAQEVDRLLKAE